jgi:transposase
VHQAEIMHTMSVATPSSSKPRRRVHCQTFKRRLVELSLVPGASVAAIALEHGINANLLFDWRKTFQQSQAQHAVALPVDPAAVLLPVEIAPPSAQSSAPARSTGVIEIELHGARVRLRGAVDEENLRTVLQALRTFA